MVTAPQELVRAIERAIDAEQGEQTWGLVQELLQGFPEYPTAYLLAARVAMLQHRWEEAVSLLQRAKQRFPRHAGIRKALEQLQQQLPMLATESARSHSELLESSEPETEEVVEDLSAAGAHPSAPKTEPILRLVEGIGESTVQLRSNIVRLIPGLEFAPLRYEPVPVASGWAALPPPPPFPAFVEEALREAQRPTEELQQSLSPLEELAQRLERARIRPPEEELAEEEAASTPPEERSEVLPMVATETMARIYEQQGAYEQALRIYRELVARYPEKRASYEAAVARLEERLRNADS
ncbi:MAG: tetratricopeptide repeat protein [Candidatus Kapabacteria bacterium]|nr:tetratricopeptide repeat protein [Candidatus Kapabacteria bacterium]MDW8011951.1 tetratricopeptide repeat protein [Bacteroidota bacterium]